MDTEATPAGARASTIEVAGLDLAFRSALMTDRTPTGAQIAAAAGLAPISQPTILQVLEDGGFEDVRPDEVVPIKGGEKFIVVESDRSFRITIDGHRVDWPAEHINGEIVRKLGRVPDSKEIYYERQDTADKLLGSSDSIDLSEGGVESFYSRAATWGLNVQGVRLELSVPTITARDALVMAKFAPEEWRIYLKYADRAKEQIELATVIDLRVPGIEKIWLIPRKVDNGEAARALRRAFALLEADEDFLDERFASWETFEEAGRRWLTIQGFHVPAGYN